MKKCLNLLTSSGAKQKSKNVQFLLFHQLSLKLSEYKDQSHIPFSMAISNKEKDYLEKSTINKTKMKIYIYTRDNNLSNFNHIEILTWDQLTFGLSLE